LASKHHSLQMGEVEDILTLLLGFQEHNQVKVEVRFSVVDAGEKPDIVVAALAHDAKAEIGDLPPLASVSVRCSATKLRNLRDVVTHALYAMDFQIAVNELREAEQKSV